MNMGHQWLIISINRKRERNRERKRGGGVGGERKRRREGKDDFVLPTMEVHSTPTPMKQVKK